MIVAYASASDCHIRAYKVLLYNAEDGQEKNNDDAPENNPQYTTVYVGNLAPEARIYLWLNYYPICSLIILVFIHDMIQTLAMDYDSNGWMKRKTKL